MSTLSIALYFPFSRVKVCSQSVSIQEGVAFIDSESAAGGFTPVCHECGARAGSVHSREARAVRDLDFPSVHVWLRLAYRKVLCPGCRATLSYGSGTFFTSKGTRWVFSDP